MNSARRLHKILIDIKAQNNQNPIGQKYFVQKFPSLSSKYSPIYVYAQIINLINTVDEDISKLNLPSSRKHINQISAAFSKYSIQSQITQLANSIDDNSLTGIELCMELLDRDFPKEEIPQTKRAQILKQVQDLIAEILESDFDQSLKQFILDKLSNIEQAIYMYELDGTKSLERSLHEAVGAIALHQLQNPNSPDLKNPQWKNIRNTVGGILIGIGMFNAPLDLIENVNEATEYISECCDPDESDTADDSSLSINE